MAVDLARSVALRIDVDYPSGLRIAVPWMLDRLAERGLAASFFVVAGRNRPLRALARAGDREWRRRLTRIGALRLAPSLVRDELAGGRMLETSAARAALRRIGAEGHELGAHGDDHAWWAARVWEATPGRLSAEIERAFAALGAAAGEPVSSWASPAWRTRDDVLRPLVARGAPYLSEAWGRGPFRTALASGERLDLPHLPVSLDSSETLAASGVRPAEAIAARVLAPVEAGGFGVACLHDYHEGLLRRDLFIALLDRCVAREIRVTTLAGAARALAGATGELPVCGLLRGRLAGFAGELSRQGPSAGGAA